MNRQAAMQTQQANNVMPTPSGLLQRQCACGQHTVAGGECEECRKKREGMLQRAPASAAPVNGVPPIVYEVLRSPGQPLDAATRAFMEPRFGFDFSGVRVHTDAKAAVSARAVNALAYTVGRDLAFDIGQYAPHSLAGRNLLAHELAHVVQQGRGGASPSSFAHNDPNERAAAHAAQAIVAGHREAVVGASSVGLARAPRSPEVRPTPSSPSYTVEEPAAAQAQAVSIQRALAPSATSSDAEALAEVMGIIESIRPVGLPDRYYILMRNGETVIFTQDEYDKIQASARKILLDRLHQVLNVAGAAGSIYKDQLKVNMDQPITSGIVHLVGGIDPVEPAIAILQDQRIASINAVAAQAMIEHGQLRRAAEFFANSEKFARHAMQTAKGYKEDLISTAGTVVKGLEITRDAAFATTMALGAVAAAPVAAAMASGLGATGAIATGVTAAGTGLMIGAGGGMLRGTSAAAGAALAGGSRDEILNAGWSEFLRGAKEGAATGFGGGLAYRASAALRVGESTSKAVNIARGSVALGLGNAGGSALGTAMEGGSVTDIAKSAGISFGIGILTGPLSHGAGVINNPAVAAVARTGVGALTSGGQTFLLTGDSEAAWRSAAVGGTSSLAIGLVKPSSGLTSAQQRAFNAGQAIRAKGQAAIRTLRNATAAAMIGVSEPVPATRATSAEVGSVINRQGQQ